MSPRETRKENLITASLLGTIAGMRSMLPPAIVARSRPRSQRIQTLRKLTYASAVLELVGDKTPFIPARISGPALVGRLASACAMTFAATRGRPFERAASAVLSVAPAAISSHALYRARRFATSKLGLPNVIAGLLEDVAALWVAKATSARLRAAQRPVPAAALLRSTPPPLTSTLSGVRLNSRRSEARGLATGKSQ